MRIVIVGAGVTGQFAKRMFPDATMIAPDSSSLPSPFFVWRTSHTDRFFEEYDIDFSLKEITYDYEKIPEELLKKQIAAYNELTYKPIDNVPTGGAKKFEAYDIDMRFERPDIISSVVSLHTHKTRKLGKNVILQDGTIIPFDVLIWTAPIGNFLWNGIAVSATYSPIGFISCRISKDYFNFEPTYLYLLSNYWLSKNIYRVVKHESEYESDFAKFIFEVARCDAETLEAAKAHISRAIFSESVFSSFMKTANTGIRKFGHIVSGDPIPEMNGVYFVGRYAQLDRNIKAHHTIHKLYQIGEVYERTKRTQRTHLALPAM